MSVLSVQNCQVPKCLGGSFFDQIVPDWNCKWAHFRLHFMKALFLFVLRIWTWAWTLSLFCQPMFPRSNHAQNSLYLLNNDVQETPGTSGQGGMSAKVTAEDGTRQFSDVLHKSRGKLFHTACNIVVEHKWNSSMKHFSTAKVTWGMAET